MKNEISRIYDSGRMVIDLASVYAVSGLESFYGGYQFFVSIRGTGAIPITAWESGLNHAIPVDDAGRKAAKKKRDDFIAAWGKALNRKANEGIHSAT